MAGALGYRNSRIGWHEARIDFFLRIILVVTCKHGDFVFGKFFKKNFQKVALTKMIFVIVYV